MSKTFTARYDGKCQRGCGGMVLKGQNAWYDRNGHFGHVLCPTAPVKSSDHPLAGWNATFSAPDMPKAAPAPKEKMVPGVYKLADGRVYAVRTRKDKTGLYAMKMIANTTDRKMENGEKAKVEFEYEYGVVLGFESDVIKLSDRMSVDEGKELATLYGKCIACQRTLKAAKSVEQGIGPVCITYFGPVFETKTAETVDGRNVTVAA